MTCRVIMTEAPARTRATPPNSELRPLGLVERLEELPQFLRALSGRPSRYLFLLYLATLVWIALWAGYDVVIVRMAFPQIAGSQGNVPLYWSATWGVLFPVTTLLAFRRNAWLPILAMVVGGWEDILFYWIQGVPVPPRLLGSTDILLFLRAAIFLAASMAAALSCCCPPSESIVCARRLS